MGPKRSMVPRMRLEVERRHAAKLFDALRRITLYDSPEKIRKHAEKEYGPTGEEAIEYAYENVLTEARQALKGMRRPKV